MYRKFVFALGFLCLPMACRSATPITSGSSPTDITPSQPPAEPQPSAARIWRLSPAVTSQQYRAVSISSLALAGVRDSLVSSIALTLNSQPADTTIIFSGTVDSISTLGGTRIGAGNFPSLPIAFSGRLSRDSLILTTSAGCSDAHFPLELVIPQVLFTLPQQQISPGFTWTDSTRISTCSGSIPLSETVIHSFRVMGENAISGRSAILINRTDQTRSSGGGSQGQHQVTVETTTSGSTQLWIDGTTGQLLKSTSQSTGTVTITASGRRQAFSQITSTTISTRF